MKSNMLSNDLITMIRAGIAPGIRAEIAPSPFALETPDLFAVGLVLAIVGGFLLANSILFRHPRSLVIEHFGGARSLTSIRGYIFRRVQVHLGFFFLLLGFGLQLFGRTSQPDATGGVSVVWIGAILAVVVVLELVGWWLSHALFRRYVRQFLIENPSALGMDMALARELGELFGIPSAGDDTVQSYLLRVRRAVGIPGPVRSAPRMPTPLEAEEELV